MQKVFLDGTTTQICFWNMERLPRNGDRFAFNNTLYEFVNGAFYVDNEVHLYVIPK